MKKFVWTKRCKRVNNTRQSCILCCALTHKRSVTTCRSARASLTSYEDRINILLYHNMCPLPRRQETGGRQITVVSLIMELCNGEWRRKGRHTKKSHFLQKNFHILGEYIRKKNIICAKIKEANEICISRNPFFFFSWNFFLVSNSSHSASPPDAPHSVKWTGGKK